MTNHVYWEHHFISTLQTYNEKKHACAHAKLFLFLNIANILINLGQKRDNRE